jgi:hypothetical protein
MRRIVEEAKVRDPFLGLRLNGCLGGTLRTKQTT